MKRTTVIVLLFALAGCEGDKQSPPAAAAAKPQGAGSEVTAEPSAAAAKPGPLEPVAIEASEAAKTAATGLAGKLEGDSFPSAVVVPENVGAFTWLAASSSDPKVVVGALWALDETLDPDAPLPAGLTTVMTARMSAADPDVVDAAFTVSGQAVGRDNPDAAVVQALVGKLGDKNAAVRKLAVRALATAGSAHDEHVLAGLSDDEPIVVLEALASTRFSPGSPFLDKFRERLARLIEHHPNPGVRGNAAKVIGSYRKAEPAVVAKLTAMLSDDTPYVRASAAEALGKVGHAAAIPAIAKLLDDEGVTRFVVEGPDLAPGSKTSVTLGGSSTVGYRCVAALGLMSQTTGKDKFEHGTLDYNKHDDMKQKVASAKVWAKKHK